MGQVRYQSPVKEIADLTIESLPANAIVHPLYAFRIGQTTLFVCPPKPQRPDVPTIYSDSLAFGNSFTFRESDATPQTLRILAMLTKVGVLTEAQFKAHATAAAKKAAHNSEACIVEGVIEGLMKLGKWDAVPATLKKFLEQRRDPRPDRRYAESSAEDYLAEKQTPQDPARYLK